MDIWSKVLPTFAITVAVCIIIVAVVASREDKDHREERRLDHDRLGRTLVGYMTQETAVLAMIVLTDHELRNLGSITHHYKIAMRQGRIPDEQLSDVRKSISNQLNLNKSMSEIVRTERLKLKRYKSC